MKLLSNSVYNVSDSKRTIWNGNVSSRTPKSYLYQFVNVSTYGVIEAFLEQRNNDKISGNF